MRHLSGGKLAILAAIAGALALALAVMPRSHDVATPSLTLVAPAKTGVEAPSLYCEFFDFMHKSVVASYDFTLDGHAPPHFLLHAVVMPDGTRTVSTDDQKPSWAYTMEDDTPTLVAPDGETRIVMYGLKPHASGVLWGEAGVRSNLTRNLEGRCRQAYFDEALASRIAGATNDKGSTR